MTNAQNQSQSKSSKKKRSTGPNQSKSPVAIDGYQGLVAVGADGRRWLPIPGGRMEPVDELVCRSFNGPRPSPTAIVEHMDGDLANDCANNLRWTEPAAATGAFSSAPNPATNGLAPTGFVVQPGLTIMDVFDKAHTDSSTPTVIIGVERTDTASGSMDKFMHALNLAKKPGISMDGYDAPIRNGIVHMKDVGVVIRDAQGVRVHAPSGTPRLPALFAPTNGNDVYAAFGDEVVARGAGYVLA